MSITTLHYLFSSIPQVLATTAAILAAVLFFRIERVGKCLIGDGKALIRRFYKNIGPLKILEGLMINRLEDAVDRESIPEVKEVIKFLSDSEINQGISKLVRPKGFQYLFIDRFLPTEKYMNNLKNLTIGIIAIKICTILLSVLYLSLTDTIFNSPCRIYYIDAILFLFISGLVLSSLLIIYSLKKQTIYEDLDFRNKITKANAGK